MAKRVLFDELMQGIQEMAAARRKAGAAIVAAGCYQSVKDLDLDPTMPMIYIESNPRFSSVLTCDFSCIDQKAGRND
ncbi:MULTISPECIES: hypothetical protein [Pseudomonas]|uniref:hypothetical protein n=1 Tax=Pseudomonas TaxID=286 RepID=UPI0011BDB6D5|nr:MULTISPECIES: hypothetical protein [unclassified Pseudomonas]MCU1773173.1 hypothetical protein [Pseudomonas sp. 13B_3.2_Bac1]